MGGEAVILGADSVVRLRGRSRDNFGNLAGADEETPITGCSVQPLGGTESTDRGEMVVANATLIAPLTPDIAPTDRIRIGTDVYAVNGPPKVWTVPGMEHQEAELTLREGNG